MKLVQPSGLVLAFLLSSSLLSASTSAETVHGYWPGQETTAKPDAPTAPAAPVTSAPKAPLNPVNAINSAPPTPMQASPQTQAGPAYLGIGVDVLPQSVVAQLPSGVSTGEGIIVTRFANDSPAKISGLQVNDILLAYDGTKLLHPKQFIDLVHNDKPGREVTLKVLRNGKIISHTVTLGMQNIPTERNGLVIKQLGKNDYLAIIHFTDANGKQQKREYRGTRQQIYYQAYQARDLPPKDREQILYAAGGPRHKSKSGWGSMFPFGNNNSNNGWGSFFPFGNHNKHNNSWGGMFPFNNR